MTTRRQNHTNGRPDPEVVPRAQRRRFSPTYKLRILDEADACEGKTALDALLRREGLYSSHLSNWRRQKAQGRLTTGARSVEEFEELQAERDAAVRRSARLERRLEIAELIIDVQHKVSMAYGFDVSDTRSR